MNWANEEFKTLALGDERLNARAVLLAQRLASKPTESIPNENGTYFNVEDTRHRTCRHLT